MKLHSVMNKIEQQLVNDFLKNKAKPARWFWRAASILSVFAFFFLMSGQILHSQTTGDYRSATTGNWTTLSTWQRWSGSAWTTPSSGEGYPGQNTGTGAVTIQSGHTVTIGTGGITTQSMGSLTIQNTGQLYLTGSNTQVIFTLNTSVLAIQSGGSIYFFNKVRLVLSADAALTGAFTGALVGDCSNNDEIFIGTVKFAACAGAPGNIFTFTQLMTSGGTLNAIPTSNSPICQGSTINLTGNYSGAIGTTPTYSWSVTAPGGAVTAYTTKDVSISSAVTGTYSAKLTVTTVLSGTTYTNSETISVIVNPLPTLTGASQDKTVCDGSSAKINLTGLVPSTTFTVNYKINNVAQTPITSLVSDGSGNSSFTTPVLAAANNGQTLQITGITITSSPTNCPQTFTQNVTLSVWTTGSGTWVGTVSSDWNNAGNWCGGVPTSTTDVYIPPTSTSVPNQPVIGTAGGVCRNITINSGASLTINSSNALSVNGNWVNNGTFTPNTGSVSFVGSTAQSLGGSGTNTFQNLAINNTSGVTAGSNITVNGVLNLAAANPSGTKGSLEMVTDYSNYPGTTNTNPGYNNMVSYTLFMGATATTTGQGDVTGIIKRTTIAANTAYTFGNQYTTVSITSGGTLPTALSVTVMIGASPYATMYLSSPDNKSIKRMYEIVPTGGSSCYVDVNFHYLDSELNSETEANLVTTDGDIGGGSSHPDEHGRAAYDITNNYVGMSNIPIDYFIFVDPGHAWRTIFTLRAYQTTYKVWDGSETGKDANDWFAELNWTPSGVPGTGDFVLIPSGLTRYPVLKNNQNPSINTLTIQSGATLNLCSNCGNSFTINNSLSGGWEDQNYGASPGNSTVVFANPGATVSGLSRFNNVTINTGADLTVQSGTNMRIAGTLTRNGTGKFYADIYPNTVDYNGAAQTVVLPDDNRYYNLTLSGSGAKTFTAGITMIQGNFELAGTATTSPGYGLTIGGNITLGSGTTFTAGAYTHNLGGNFINNGGTFTNTGSTINLNGTSPQTLGGTQSTTFNNLTLNNTAGATLGISETVNGTLNMTSGLLTTTSANKLTMACTGSITNAGTSSYINGPLARMYCATGSKDFPIGKGGNFRQLTLNYTALTGTSTVTSEQFESTITGSIPANTTYQLGRYWTITQSGGSGFTYSLTLNGDSFNPGDGSPVILQGDGSTNTARTASYSSPNFTATGLNTFSNFAVASNCPTPTINTQPVSPSAVCAGTGTPQFTVSASGGTLSYQWEVSPTGTGGTYSTVTNGGVYSNATTATLTITNPPYSMNGYAYRVVVTRSCGSSITSNGATLPVNALPTITLGANPSVCSGVTSANLPYTATTGSPNQYRIDYDATAEGAGFVDVSYPTTLPSSPIVLTVPANAGTYNGTIYVKNSTTTCESVGYPFTVTIYMLPQGSLTGTTICSGGNGLVWTATAGTGPFTVVYNDGSSNHTATNVYSGVPFAADPNPGSPGTYNYTLISVAGTYCTRTTGFDGINATTTVVSSGTWVGVTSTDWFEASNWCGGVPISSSDIIIPSGTKYQPAISAGGGVCHNITINSGASLTFYGAYTLGVYGNWTNSGTFTPDVGTVSFTGSTAQSILSATTFYNLTMNNNSGLTLSSVDAILSNALTLTSGIITTGTNKLIMGSAGNAGTLTRTSGHINGNLRRYVPNISAPTVDYPIGDATNYTPITVAFVGTVSGSGYLDASTVAIGSPPDVASGLSQTKYVNRKWTITNGGVGGFTSFDPTFTFVPADIMGSANTANFIVKEYSGSSWYPTGIGTTTSTSTQCTGITLFGDFYVGELSITFIITNENVHTK